MILTVTLNPALDITYRVDRLQLHAVNRVDTSVARAGGKGVNVSRVLDQLGVETVATGLCGGTTGAAIADELAAAGIPERFTTIAGESRRTVAVVEQHGRSAATGLWEPGPTVAPPEWRRFVTRYEALVRAAAVVVLSGSAPPGLPTDAYAQLVAGARRHGRPVVLDTSGAPLAVALAAEPTVIKPNAGELEQLTGIAARGPASVLRAAAAARALGARHVVASLGPAGIVTLGDDGAWRARLPRALRGNDTGAGDAAVATLADGLRRERTWPDTLRHAVAASAAAVLAPLAGAIDEAAYARLLPEVQVARMAD